MAGTKHNSIGPDLIEKWALGYLERFASSAENLRRVLRRRVRRQSADPEISREAAKLINDLVERYRDSGLIDDVAYAAGRARNRLARGEPLRKIAAGLAAKGVEVEDRAAALDALRETAPDPDLAAACAFARRRRLGPFRRSSSHHQNADHQNADHQTADHQNADHRRELAVFARAGFARREAEAVLACADPEAIAALLAGEEG